MKQLSIIILTATLLVAAACKKGSNSPNNFYTMTATVDTAAFVADGPSKAYISGTIVSGMENTDLYGKTDDGRVIQITISSSPGIPIPRGVNIPFNTVQAQARYYPLGFTGAFVYGVSGSVIINAVTPNYQGSFSFTCADSTRVTNGKFTIKAP